MPRFSSCDVPNRGIVTILAFFVYTYGALSLGGEVVSRTG
jgi:hypothetical protein